jgi:hypothetical protein
MNRFALAFSLCGVAAACLAEPLKLYVAPQGRDEWSGLRRRPGILGKDGPFRTLERARDEIRQRRAATTLPVAGAVVELQPGVYPLAQTRVRRVPLSSTAPVVRGPSASSVAWWSQALAR